MEIAIIRVLIFTCIVGCHETLHAAFGGDKWRLRRADHTVDLDDCHSGSRAADTKPQCSCVTAIAATRKKHATTRSLGVKGTGCEFFTNP
jgi:hypothetical protein